MPQTVKDWPWFGAAVIVIAYACLIRLNPVGADDLFFLLNTARWIVERGEIPWIDAFSYTAPGAPWIYPIGSGLLFYAAWVIGGYGALSALPALGCATTVTLTLRRGSLPSVVLAALAVPLIAARCEA